MVNTPMVLMWGNADGTVTLSQRSTAGYIMPTVDPAPPRVATLELETTVVSRRTLWCFVRMHSLHDSRRLPCPNSGLQSRFVRLIISCFQSLTAFYYL